MNKAETGGRLWNKEIGRYRRTQCQPEAPPRQSWSEVSSGQHQIKENCPRHSGTVFVIKLFAADRLPFSAFHSRPVKACFFQ
ncbi:MAG: hypothetical protein EA344_13450 [Alkalicoccus sp.]|uniref:Uncharacterized protein n=1 Tax=Alkalicoccus sp. TaxID=2005376 RepID=A0A651DIG8_9BACI|nr:MAG: hypothetical protein EA344_13450 [Alkalicoccus sp.]